MESTPDAEVDEVIEHTYPAVYRDVLFPLLESKRDRFFDREDVCATAQDQLALALLMRSGAVIAWGDRLSLGQPHKALIIFATSELMRPGRVRWSPREACDALIAAGSLIPGSAEAVMRHFQLGVNPVGTPPETVWHGNGPSLFTTTAHPGWIPWVNDGLTGDVPVAVAYADLFGVSDWRADEFADFTLRKILPREGIGWSAQ